MRRWRALYLEIELFLLAALTEMDSRRSLFQLLGDCAFVQPSLLGARQRLPALLGCGICRDNVQRNIFVDAMTACTSPDQDLVSSFRVKVSLSHHLAGEDRRSLHTKPRLVDIKTP